MAKRKGKKVSNRTIFDRLRRRSGFDVDQVVGQAEEMLLDDRPEDVIEYLAPLVADHPREAELHYYLGMAHVHMDNLWQGLQSLRQAQKLSRQPDYWLTLAFLYTQLSLNALALHAFRKVLKAKVEVPELGMLHKSIEELEAEVLFIANQLALTPKQAEKGLRYLEEGQIALQNGDYQDSIQHNRRAIKVLDDWPPPYNNLSLAQFFSGQPQAAIATARRVLAQEPDNLQALANAIRYLAWSGQEEEAQALWPRLEPVKPIDDSQRIKKAEAAAILEKDEQVYRLLQPLFKSRSAPQPPQIQLRMAAAEANTGRTKTAQRRLRQLVAEIPWAEEWLAALQAGRPGPGWASRYPYFHTTELVPRTVFISLMQLMTQEEEISSKKHERKLSQLAASYPQLVRMGEKLIIEDDQPLAGVDLLAALGTPEAYAALRRYALGQIGEDEDRMQALSQLAEAGQIDPTEPVRIWRQDEWREVEVRGYQITDEPEVLYDPEAADLVDRGLEALKRGQDDEAERLLQAGIERDPRIKEAYNNLALIYAERDEDERAKELYYQAIEVDPYYVFPRANLALYMLGEDDLAGAEEMLAPLAESHRFTPNEMLFYFFIQAQVAVYKQEYDQARQVLQMALDIDPDYEPAQDLLDRVEFLAKAMPNWKRFREQQAERDRAKRLRHQAQLTGPAPSLKKVLPVYTKDMLTEMGRHVIPEGGWSTLRKAELVDLLIESLTDPANLAEVVNKLTDRQREALRTVVAAGGYLPWERFDEQYDNDLEVSPYWQYHTPKTVMGMLRLYGLLAETTVDGELRVTIPQELRQPLAEILSA